MNAASIRMMRLEEPLEIVSKQGELKQAAHWEEPVPVVFTPSYEVFLPMDKMPPEPCRLWTNQCQLSQLLLVSRVLPSP